MSQLIWGEETQFFHSLTPDQVFKASEILGKRLTGRVLTLNSLENRVYDVELAQDLDTNVTPGLSQRNVIVKFYRPGRWSQEQIKEEHFFLQQLVEFEVPAIAPLEIGGETLHYDEETKLSFALFPKVQGRLKDELNKEEIDQIGRIIGRVHNVGSMGNFTKRLNLNTETFIISHHRELQKTSFLSDKQSFRYYLDMLPMVAQVASPFIDQLQVQRLHGDFHRGNIVWTSTGPMVVDFDDCLTGPCEQDLWLLFPGKDEYSLTDRERFLSAYKEMTRKDHLKINLVEVFRTMRMIHFNGWIAKRWDDQSFQRMFPQFNSDQYWDQQLLDLRIQLSLIQDIFNF